MKGIIDLQVHTHFSDGGYSPEELLTLAKKYNITTIAVTDHNTVAGIPEALAAGKKLGIRVVPGVEIYTQFDGKELHLLGYEIDHTEKRLLAFLKKSQDEHRDWLDATLKKLAAIGMHIDREEFAKSPSSLMGYGELIWILQQDPGNAQRIQQDLSTEYPDLFDVINHYFIAGKNAHVPVPEKSMPIEEAIEHLQNAHGIPVLAHPGQTLSFSEDSYIKRLQSMGVRGIEAVTPHHTWHQVYHYLEIAKRFGMYATAGSDFHHSLSQDLIVKNRWDYFHPLQTTLPWE